MALLKALVVFTGIFLAVYFYSAGDVFEPAMLKGKRVIVTGASSGIGEQMAYHLAKMGSHILITARTEEKLKKVVAQCTHLGAASAHYIAGSMDTMTFAKLVVHKAENLFGGLDMLILNHIGHTYFGYFDGNIDHVRDLLEINVLSYATMTVAALPMLKKSNGNVVVVSSVAGELKLSFLKLFLGILLLSKCSLILAGVVKLSISWNRFYDVHHPCLTDSALKTVSGVIQQPAAPKEECALEIIKGGALRKREVYYQYHATKIPLLLRDWAPELLQSLLLKNYNMDNFQRKEV
eukprot:XP_012811347.1 PREDICTED: corticosteroid 11-beta-dehydrogenase isozyme 1 [Xenopus tropicalis]